MEKIAMYASGAHGKKLEEVGFKKIPAYEDIKFTYTFENFFHPFLGELIKKLNEDSLPGILDATWQKTLKADFFNALYKPTQDNVTRVKYFPKEIDVSVGGPYANYNWELFFHIPLTIAVHLSKNQRFAEAQRWFHYIFDPTCNDTSIDIPERFWKFLAFRNPDKTRTIDEILKLLSEPENTLDAAKKVEQRAVLEGYKAILEKPFQPHVVARTRHLAYQYSVVMKYLDNLIAWGDHLFQQDTVESINEATQRYVLAANLLGARPQRIPPRGKAQAKSFAQLKGKLGPIGNALVDLEGQFPFNIAAPNSGSSGTPEGSSALFGIGHTLYFCIPRNDKMLGYWDTVGDRLFKIRHCMNIAGVVRQLALFDPPIDPGMLIKAAAAGINISSIVNGTNQPIGPVRSLALIQKVLELCGEVRGLGGALLAAIEKGEGEKLALLRQSHEVQIQTMAQEVRFLQWKSAQEATKSLLTSRKAALERLHYYQRLLGLSADPNAPDTLTLDQSELTEENFDEAFDKLVGKYGKELASISYPQRKLADADSPLNVAEILSEGRLYLTEKESLALNVLPLASAHLKVGSAANDLIVSMLSIIPHPKIHVTPIGLGPEVEFPIGQAIASVGGAISRSVGTAASLIDSAASFMGQTASYERRADDWMLQHNLATHELMQVGRQILTSLIAEQIAHHEYQNIQQQIKNAEEVDRFLHDKFTSKELYLWMQGEISRLYYEYYRFAFDIARKAEKTMKQELMRPEVDAQDFIKFNYWDGGRKGLLSGEALHLDVKRMEMAYHDNNKRELEMTRHISLRQLDPIALLTLKVTGGCQVAIPEWLYDLDGPGHYMRRIKSVALSIPSVVGPYTSVNCTLSLLKSSLRKSPLPKENEYLRQGTEDDRFVDYSGAVQSIVTSSGQNDSGMFETNLRDERFLPFEGAGAESTWRLELPKDYPVFDYATISDVILHVRYTARQGVDPTKVKTALAGLFQQANPSNLALLLSLRHDFPTEWSAFVNGTGAFTAAIRKEYFPYIAQGKTITISGLDLYDGQNVAKHHTVSNTIEATGALLAQKQFILTAEEDAAGPTQVLTRSPSAQVFLIIRYSLS